MNIFSLFKSSNQENDPSDEGSPEDENSSLLECEDLHASVTYFVGADGMPRVDVELKDYKQETLDNFCKLLMSLSTDLFFFETLDTIKEGLIKEDRADIFAEIASQLTTSVARDLIADHIEKCGEEPCVSPSDVLQ